MLEALILAAVAVLQPSGEHSHGSASAAAAIDFAPSQPGHDAYAALGEVVGILAADPSTDWSKVNVDALRAHLIDMDNVTMRAKAATEKLANGARFRVTGSGEVIGSIQRMTQSHFVNENVPGGWKMTIRPLTDGALVTVTSDAARDAQRIQALGFFGILTLGSHHQPHHLMIAKGLHH